MLQIGFEPTNTVCQWSIPRRVRLGLRVPANCSKNTVTDLTLLAKKECVEPNATEWETSAVRLRNVTLFAVRPVSKSGQVGCCGRLCVGVYGACFNKHASGPARRMKWVGCVLPLKEEKYPEGFFLSEMYFIELGIVCRIH
jgi:hypothetical protein